MKKLRLLPAALIILLLPLIFIPIGFQNRLSEYSFSSASSVGEDCFLIGKDIFFTAMAMLMLAVTIARKKLPMKCSVPLMVFAVLCIASTFSSQSRQFSLLGIENQFEPLAVLLDYCIVAVCGAALLEPGDMELLLRALTVDSLAVSLIGLLQLAARTAVCSTLYNQNYIGSYCSLVLPLTACAFFIFRKKDRKWAAAAAAGSLLLIAVTFASASAGGVITTAAAAAIGSGAYFRKKHRAAVFAPVLLIAAGIILLAVLWNASWKEPATQVTDVSTSGECAVFTRDGIRLSIGFRLPDDDSYAFYVLDDSGNQIDYDENDDGSMYVIPDSRYLAYSFMLTQLDDGTIGFVVYVDGRQWYFGLDDNGGCRTMNGYGRLVDLVHAPYSKLFENHEGFLSSRGYIWSRTLPLIKKYFLTGSGPDTFTIVFPQNDIGKYISSDYQYDIIFTKPHSIYLQTAVQLGLPALAVLIIFMLRTISALWKKAEGNIESAGLLAALSGFMLIGLINDSCVCVTPIAAVLAGAAMRNSGT